jgi:hypothetical protein
MSAVEIGIIVIIAIQGVQISYLSSIWNRMLDYDRSRGRYD